MEQIFSSLDQLIGHTPLFEPQHLMKSEHLAARILLKLEYFNPAGSIKDRAALQMLNEAERSGIIKHHSGYTVIEPTSGNTGVGLAALAASRGYRAIITMPDTMSVERRRLLTAYGAELVLTPGALGMQGAIDRAEQLARTISNSWIAGQFTNEANARAHELTTGPEIWRDTDGDVDILVSAVGTGGTITGCSHYLRQRNPDLTVAAVEPSDSPVLSGGSAGPHKIQGIGAGFIPQVLDTHAYDSIMQAETQNAYDAARLLARTEGILVGISSGAALWAAMKLARKPQNAGKTIVAIMPDTGERYLSCELFAEASQG